jgi:hypothetical protein
MRGLRSLWRRAFDIRPGEHRRVLFLGLYFAQIALIAQEVVYEPERIVLSPSLPLELKAAQSQLIRAFL